MEGVKFVVRGAYGMFKYPGYRKPWAKYIRHKHNIPRHHLFFSCDFLKESLAAVFGNGLSTACIVNVGAQVTSVVCVEDGVALPTTQVSLRYRKEDISRCLL